VLNARGVAHSRLDEIDDEVRSEINALAEKVLAAPNADPADAWTDVWSDGGWQWRN
jgi:hypothetical protein